MHIQLRLNTKRVECYGCQRPIEINARRVDQRDKAIHKWISYHDKCWAQYLTSMWKGMEDLVARDIYRYGKLTPEQSRQRLKILKKKHSIMQRKRILIARGQVTKALLLNSELDKLIDEIQLCGGVPKSWRYINVGA